MLIKTYPIKLQTATMLTPSVKHFVFNYNEPPYADFVPGQFITMHFEIDGKKFRRSYSLANATPNNLVEFAAGFVKNGPASEKLFSLQEGDTINISGPVGRLILRDEPVERYIFIATSTGVTPYLSMLQSIGNKLKNNPSLEVYILQGIQHKEDLLYGEDFINFCETHKQAHFFACYSREQGNNLNGYEHLGYIQTKLKQLIPEPKTDIIYLCGNPDMVDDTFSYLKELNFDKKNIRREKYISN
jgi:ferredoxin-NADP reductase